MMEKSAQPGVGGGARPPPFTLSAIRSKVLVYAPAERADTLPLFLLYPDMSSVVKVMDHLHKIDNNILLLFLLFSINYILHLFVSPQLILSANFSTKKTQLWILKLNQFKVWAKWAAISS
jgi:hypothetical protein